MAVKEKWNEGSIIYEFNLFKEKSDDLSAKSLNEFNKALYSAISKRFGSYKNFINTKTKLNYENISGRKQWSKEIVIKEINRLIEANEPLNSNYVKNNHLKLYNATRRIIGEWGDALKSLGINYDEVKNKIKESNKKWNKEKIISDVMLLIESGKGNTKYILENNRPLYEAICKYFSSYEDLTKELGLDYSKIRIDRKWNKELVIKEIKRLNKGNEDLSYSSISKDYGGLIGAAEKYFNTWKNAIESAGLDYNKIRKQKKWSKDEVVAVIKNRHLNNKQINSSYMQKFHQKIYAEGVGLYGSWNNAINESNIDYSKVLKREEWSYEKISIKLHEIHKNEEPLNFQYLRENYDSLLHAILNRYESLGIALEKLLGVKYSNVRIVNPKGHWTKDKVINRIKEYKQCDVPLNSAYMKVNHGALYKSGINLFGSWEETIESCGFDYKDIREDVKSTGYFGYRFEELLSNILKELNINYYKNKHTSSIKPDYIFSKYKWADAKLSEWSIYHCDTLKKYEPLCKSLTIIYMRGNPDRDEMITKKTRLISVHKFIKQLPKHRQKHYLNEIEKIEKEIHNIENVLQSA